MTSVTNPSILVHPNLQITETAPLTTDGLFPIYHLTEAMMRDRLPGLRGYVGLDGVGHWVQHEAAAQVNQDLITFARNPAQSP